MSLFVGRLPTRDFDDRDLEDIFYKYGKITKCQLKRGSRFAFGFVEFEDPQDAYDAIRDVDGLDIDGTRIVVEKAKGAPRRRDETTCYNCGEEGHWARNCTRSRRDHGGRSSSRYRSRSRTPDRYSSRHRDSYRRGRSYSRSRSPYDRRGRSYSRSPRRDSRSPRRGSRSPSRGRSRTPTGDRRSLSPRREEQPNNEQPNAEQPIAESQAAVAEQQPAEPLPTETQSTEPVVEQQPQPTEPAVEQQTTEPAVEQQSEVQQPNEEN